MDSQERQELKQNELEEFLLHFKEWFSKHFANTLLIILLIIAGVMFARWYSGREKRALETAYGELANAPDPFGKIEVATRYESLPGFAGVARLDAADMLLQQALGLTGDTATAAPNADEKKRYLEQAQKQYQLVIDSSKSAIQVFNARFGLAAVSETLGDFDKARQQYQQVEKDAGETWPVYGAQAKQMLADMDDIKSPVSFPPAPKAPPAPAASTGPSTLPGLPGGLIDSLTKPDAVVPPPAPVTPEAPPVAPPAEKPAAPATDKPAETPAK
ncbi:MAG: hypothetical protein GC162_11715 [Planctomycetes bacterium]|nr:hypothetical protein [Planctomycetota bacterium]